MGLFERFPYTNFHELNATWIIEELVKLKTTIEQFVSINALKYADPIQWDITTQYEKNTIVIDPITGTAYISVQPVPSGIALTNTDYWAVVFDLGSFVVRAAKNFTSRYEADTTLTATFPSNVNDWLIWGDTLYRAASNIIAGDQYIVGSNIIPFTIEDIIGHIQSLNTTDKSNLVAAINELVQALINEAARVDAITGDPDNLITTDKSNLVAAINEVMTILNNRYVELKELIVNARMTSPKILNGNLILEDIRSTDYTLQGSCYVGNNTIVAYLASTVTDTGKLVAYNLQTYTKLWEHSILGYHGNSLCYRPADNCIYICGMKPVGSSDLFNTIVVVDLADPSQVARIITPPVATLYSIAYDEILDKFYSINERGTTPGVADLLYAYNGIFDSIDYTVQLEYYPATYAGSSSQGVTYARDGIIYYFGYEYPYPNLIGADARTGKAVLIAQTPDFINEYREVGEEEQLIYDWDNDRYIMGSVSSNTGLKDTAINMFYELDIYKPIIPVRPQFGINKYSLTSFTSEDTHLSDLRPYDHLNITNFKTPQDVLNIFKIANIFGFAKLLNSTVYHLDTVGYSGQIGGEAGNHAQIDYIVVHGGSTIRFLNCDFINKFTPIATYNAQVQIDQGADVTFWNCEFDDYTADETNPVHILSQGYGKIKITDCIFNSTKQQIMAARLTEVYDEQSLEWDAITGSFTGVANTYVLTPITFTVPAHEYWDVFVNVPYSSLQCLGIKISISDSNENSQVRVAEGNPIIYSPTWSLRPGTYYVWVKANTNATNPIYVYVKTSSKRN